MLKILEIFRKFFYLNFHGRGFSMADGVTTVSGLQKNYYYYIPAISTITITTNKDVAVYINILNTVLNVEKIMWCSAVIVVCLSFLMHYLIKYDYCSQVFRILINLLGVVIFMFGTYY